MNRADLVSNLRYARFLAKGAYFAALKFRDGTKISPALLVEQCAAENPNRIAIHFEDEKLTYRELDAKANRFAHALVSAGFGKGDVVAMVIDNRPEHIATLVAANKLGGVVALVNTNLVGAQLEHAIGIAKPKLVLVGAEHASKVAAIADSLPVSRQNVLVVADRGAEGDVPGSRSFDALVEAAPSTRAGDASERTVEDPFVYIYTSGTTGLPKAASVKTGRFLKASFLFGQNVLGVQGNDVVYSSGLPLYHSSGAILGWGSTLSGGGTFVIRRKFSARAYWDDCAKYGVTVITYIGELCRYLLNAPSHPKEKAHHIRAAIGAGLRPDIWDEFSSRFGLSRIYEFYGATEGNVGIVNIDGRPGMMGRLLPGQCVLAADPYSGELLIDANGKGRKVAIGEVGLLVGQINRMNSFDGYVDRSKNDSKIFRDPIGDGKDYFNTGDLVKLHDRGYVSFKDRMGDTFRWKAENVSTNEVQETLNRHPSVAESNVYGVEIPGTDGRAGMASIVVQEGFDLDSFASHVRSSLPLYARPLFVRVQAEMQTTGTFKHVKTELRAQGYDPAKVTDDLYFFEEQTRYVPMTDALHVRITSGELKL